MANYIEMRDGVCIISVEGAIDVRKVGKFKSLVSQAVRRKPLKIVLDFSKLTFIDSSGIGVVTMLIGKLGLKYNQIAVVDSPSNICHILALTGLSGYLMICSSLEEAIQK